MKVFLTGPTGHVGAAVARVLGEAGHRVVGLLRSAGKRRRLARGLGAEPVFGDVAIPASYRAAAQGCDLLIHAARVRDGDTVGADRTAVDALLDAARTAERPRGVIYTSGTWVLGDTGSTPADETAPTRRPAGPVAWRPRHEEIVLDAAGDGLTTAVVRPGLVYGGGGGLLAPLFRTAAAEGAAIYPGDGEQHWSLVHREDLGRLYLRIGEEAAGGVFHGVDDMPVEAREVARAASRAAGAGGRVRELSRGEARSVWGAWAGPLRLDQRVGSARGGEVGWAVDRPSFPEAAAVAFQEWRDRRGEPGEGAPATD